MHIQALRPFGMEVSGIDIGSLPQQQSNEFTRLIAANRVVVFHGQKGGDAELVRFLRGFGDLTFTKGETPVRDTPELNVVSNVGRTTPPRSVFHTDTSYVARPPAFSALRSVLLPEAGGETVFSDQVAAVDRLPARIRSWLEGRTVLHSATGVEGSGDERRHPLFRRHPTTGETALFLSTPERCTHLSGVDRETSRRVITLLYRHSIRPSTLYRHSWRTGDVVIWDNRNSMHRADHNGVLGDRVMHRGMVLGEEPVAA